MATRFAFPVPQIEDADGLPQSGGKLYFYTSGGNVAKDTFSDAALTTANANPVILDARGMPTTDIFLEEGTYRVTLRDSADVLIRTFDPVDGAATTTSAAGGAEGGGANVVVNPCFQVFERLPGSVADDTYTFVNWYALAQSNNIAWSQLTAPATGLSTALRLTQSHATAQRMGVAQLVESRDVYPLRSQDVVLQAKVRLSTGGNVRAAILAWTGTADAPTSDVVSDWTSGSYATSAFFIATTTAVVACDYVAAAAATWTDLVITGEVGVGANNVCVLFWTEDTAAQNVTLDVTNVLLAPGTEAVAFTVPSFGAEAARCQRYSRTVGGEWAGTAVSGTFYPITQSLAPRMLAAPTCVSASDPISPTSFVAAATGDLDAGETATYVVRFLREANASAFGRFMGVYVLSAEL